MPNHVMNIVRISGSEESIARCSEQIFKGGEFSFQNIKPMPEDLDIPSGSMSYTAMEWMKADERTRRRIEKKYGLDNVEGRARMQRYAINVALYGFPTWYEWRLENWGTKWDAYEISVIHRSDRAIHIAFQTAWSTPQAVIETLAGQYPDLAIDVDFADENMGNNCGSYSIIDGNLWEEVGDYDFACELWGYDPMEEAESEEVEAS